jgi:dynein heavy chain
MAERPYEEIQDREKLQSCCEEALNQYNMMTEKPMELVLFSFALEHLVRISRILKQPSGHAMLVGVGGSGRQSLTRLSSKMGDNEIYQVEIKKNYRMQEWRDDMKNLLRMCGGKGQATSFIFTDTQIKEEGFLEDVNNILNTGEIPNLFAPDEKADLCELVRPAAKSENRCPEGTPAQLFSFFIERCRRKLHIVLCFSPIGESFRGRVRNFPSLVNCTTIDWFSEWPKDALESVARRFLGDIGDMDTPVRNSCVQLVQMFHESTAQAAVRFKDELRRHYYVTPTSYLELITTFKTILTEKRVEVKGLQDRYENGYKCLIQTEASVSKMQKELEDLQPKLIEASKETEIKEKIVEGEAVEAEKIRVVVAADEAVAAKAAGEANAIKEDCERELADAMPILNAASKALDCITKNDITDAKKMLKPPEDQRMVLSAVCVLMGLKAESKTDPET